MAGLAPAICLIMAWAFLVVLMCYILWKLNVTLSMFYYSFNISGSIRKINLDNILESKKGRSRLHKNMFSALVLIINAVVTIFIDGTYVFLTLNGTERISILILFQLCLVFANKLFWRKLMSIVVDHNAAFLSLVFTKMSEKRYFFR